MRTRTGSLSRLRGKRLLGDAAGRQQGSTTKEISRSVIEAAKGIRGRRKPR